MKAELKIDMGGEKEAKNAISAIEQETEFRKRGRAEISREESTIMINVEADDIVALRATVNSYLRLLQIIKNVEEVE